jgi:hypothetical protein
MQKSLNITIATLPRTWTTLNKGLSAHNATLLALRKFLIPDSFTSTLWQLSADNLLAKQKKLCEKLPLSFAYEVALWHSQSSLSCDGRRYCPSEESRPTNFIALTNPLPSAGFEPANLVQARERERVTGNQCTGRWEDPRWGLGTVAKISDLYGNLSPVIQPVASLYINWFSGCLRTGVRVHNLSESRYVYICMH